VNPLFFVDGSTHSVYGVGPVWVALGWRVEDLFYISCKPRASLFGLGIVKEST